MYVRRKYFNQAGADGSVDGGAAAPSPAPAPAAGSADGGAAAPSPAPADGASGGGAAQPGSLMARGAAAPAAGPAPAGAPAADGAGDGQQVVVPEKYLVKNEDGTTNHEATALKVAQAHAALEKRMGAGEAPPKTPEEYAPEIPDGMNAEALKNDPMFAGFLKSAHAKGLNNAQVSWALSEFQMRMGMMNSPEVGAAELGKVWTNEQQMATGLANAFRATHSFAEDKDHAARLDAKFGNDPDYLRFMARIGKELGEDQAVQGISAAETQTLEDLKAHPAYRDAKHPEHAKVTAKVAALYRKQYPENA